MSKVCEICGNKNNPLSGDPFILGDNKIICYKCAKPITHYINDLYYAKSIEEYNELRNKILTTCNQYYNQAITRQITCELDEIYHSLNFINNQVATDTDTSEIKPSGLFDNIGHKIKILAKFLAWCGILLSIIIGMNFLFDEEYPIGLSIITSGSLSSLFSSILLYGFGQLIENSDLIVKSLTDKKND